MQKILPSLAAAALLATPAFAQKPPREESPAPRDALESFGGGSSDDEMARAIAAADAYPLGSLENPIRVEGPEGQQNYLARLRCSNGSTPKITGQSPGGVGAYGSVTEAFALDCGAASPSKVKLVMDMYHAENVETRAPAGFTIKR